VTFLLGAAARLLGVLLLLPISEHPVATAEIEPPGRKSP